MSASFTATGDDLTSLAAFLGQLTEATRQTGVRIVERTTVEIRDGNQIDIAYDESIEAYAVDDMVGH
jgi:hypothetical protein